MTITATAVDQPEAAYLVEHPAWCSPRRCTVTGELPLDEAVHLSAAVILDAPITVTGALAVQAWLQQLAAGDTTTYLVLDAPDIDCGRALLPVDEAATSLAALQQLIATAGPDCSGTRR